MNRGEVAGPIVLGAGLVAFTAAATLAMTDRLDDAVVAVVGGETLGQLGVTLLVVAAVALWSAARTRPAHGRAAAGHAHRGRSRRAIAEHEARHAVAARAVGGRVASATLKPGRGGGLVRARDIPNAHAHLVFLYAAGVGNRTGCDHDAAAAREVLREFPRAERAAQRRSAQAEAHRIVRDHAGQIRRAADELERTGRL